VCEHEADGRDGGLALPQQAQSMVHVDREGGKGPDPYRAKHFDLNVRDLPEEFIWGYQLHSRYSDLKPSWQGTDWGDLPAVGHATISVPLDGVSQPRTDDILNQRRVTSVTAFVCKLGERRRADAVRGSADGHGGIHLAPIRDVTRARAVRGVIASRLNWFRTKPGGFLPSSGKFAKRRL
jgi:hypothetical protein